MHCRIHFFVFFFCYRIWSLWYKLFWMWHHVKLERIWRDVSSLRFLESGIAYWSWFMEILKLYKLCQWHLKCTEIYYGWRGSLNRVNSAAQNQINFPRHNTGIYIRSRVRPTPLYRSLLRPHDDAAAIDYTPQRLWYHQVQVPSF